MVPGRRSLWWEKPEGTLMMVSARKSLRSQWRREEPGKWPPARMAVTVGREGSGVVGEVRKVRWWVGSWGRWSLGEGVSWVREGGGGVIYGGDGWRGGRGGRANG